MITYDTLTMRIPEKSLFETKFKKMFSALQEDPKSLQSFLEDPSSRLNVSGIPVVRSLTDCDFDSAELQSGPESLMEMKFHWWGVDHIISRELAGCICRGINAGTGMDQVAMLSMQKGRPDQSLAKQLIHDLNVFLRQENIHRSRGASVHWRVSWMNWATGLPVDILLYFSSGKFTEES